MSDKVNVFHLTSRGGISINSENGAAVENPGGGVYTAMCDAKQAGDESIDVAWVGKESAVPQEKSARWSEVNADWAALSSEQKTALSKGQAFLPVSGKMENGLSTEVFSVPPALRDFARQNTLDFLWGPGGHGFENLFEKNKKHAVDSLKALTFKKNALRDVNNAYQNKEIDFREAVELSTYVMLGERTSADKLKAAKTDLKILSCEDDIRLFGDPSCVAPNVKKAMMQAMSREGFAGDYAVDKEAMDARLAQVADIPAIEAKVEKVNEAMALDLGFRYQTAEAAHSAKMMRERMAGLDNVMFFSQDYDNEMVPYAMRGKEGEMPIGMFRHIPVLSTEEMNGMTIDGTPLLEHPGMKEYFARVMSSADVVGCQTDRDAKHICDIMKQIAPEGFKKAAEGENVYEFFGKKVKIQEYPIGINPQDVRRKANQDCQGETFKAVQEFAEGKNLCFIGGCRADYTKGVDEAVEAADVFLEKVQKYEKVEKGTPVYEALSADEKKEFEQFGTEQARNTVFFIQVQPTRGGHEDFDATAKRLSAKFAKLNEEFPTKSKTIFAGLPHAELMAVMKRADIKIDISIKDGMALVPKEYNAAQFGKEEPGIAIVSDGMGVARGALQINKEIEAKYGIQNAFPVVDNPVSFKSRHPDEVNMDTVNAVVSTIAEVIKRPPEVKRLINDYINTQMETYDLKWWNKVQSEDLKTMSAVNQAERAREAEALKAGKAVEYYTAKFGKDVDITELAFKPNGELRTKPVAFGQKMAWTRKQLGYMLDTGSEGTSSVYIHKCEKPKANASVIQKLAAQKKQR